jgi:hypothetical protein
MMRATSLAVLPHKTHVRARRRIQIARYTLEHGITDLLTTQDVLCLLTLAVADLDEARVIEEAREVSDRDVLAQAAA